jgi:MFS family permease
VVNRVSARYGRPFGYLWSARTISFSGDVLAQVALVVLAAQQRDSSLAVSLLLLAQTLPRLLGPLAGIIADRKDSRRMMITCELGQALLVAVVALAALPFMVMLALVAAMTTLATLFQPAGQSALPALIPADVLSDGNALLRLGANVSRVAGPAVAGLLLATTVGVSGVLALDTLSFLASAALLSRLPVLPPVPSKISTPEGTVSASLRYLIHHPVARAVTLGLFLATLFVALDNVGLVFLAEQTLHGGSPGYGLAMAGYGVGMVVAPLLLLRFSARLQSPVMLLAGIAVMGLGTLLCGLAPSLALAVALQGIVGTGNGFQNVANDTLLQQSVSREMLGRIFGVAYSAPYAALLITYAGGGALLALTSPRVVFVVAGLGTIATLPIMGVLLARGGYLSMLSPSEVCKAPIATRCRSAAMRRRRT